MSNMNYQIVEKIIKNLYKQHPHQVKLKNWDNIKEPGQIGMS
jgi:predicted transcriptional regulator